MDELSNHVIMIELVFAAFLLAKAHRWLEQARQEKLRRALVPGALAFLTVILALAFIVFARSLLI